MNELVVPKFPAETYLSLSKITNEVALGVALSFCQNLFGVLIPPRNIDEVEYLKGLGFTKVWVGDLKKVTGSEIYVSSSGHFLASNVPGEEGPTAVTGPNTFPKNKCASFSLSNGKVANGDCNILHQFVCLYPNSTRSEATAQNLLWKQRKGAAKNLLKVAKETPTCFNIEYTIDPELSAEEAWNLLNYLASTKTIGSAYWCQKSIITRDTEETEETGESVEDTSENAVDTESVGPTIESTIDPILTKVTSSAGFFDKTFCETLKNVKSKCTKALTENSRTFWENLFDADWTEVSFVDVSTLGLGIIFVLLSTINMILSWRERLQRKLKRQRSNSWDSVSEEEANIPLKPRRA